ncbi:MAG: hypothetical protein ACRDI2_25450 [Chloroflexota bacterium]
MTINRCTSDKAGVNDRQKIGPPAHVGQHLPLRDGGEDGFAYPPRQLRAVPPPAKPTH